MRLVRLPLAAAMLPVHLALSATKGALDGALAVARLVQQAVAGADDRVAARDPFAEAEPYAPPPPEPPAEAPAPPEPPPEPAHVSEEPELVAEVAEQGAEEGAGPEVEVAEPWPGYDGMRAQEVRARLAGESAAVAAAVTLYETQHKGRTSVLRAANGRVAG